jgi:hypothetical protein
MACNLDKWERSSLHPPGFWTVVESIIGPLSGLVSEEQLIPVPDEFRDCSSEPNKHPNGPDGVPAGMHKDAPYLYKGWL